MSEGPLVCASCGSSFAAEAESDRVCVSCALGLALEEPSSTIGPYRLIRRIGEGGMGEVWEAEQTSPVKRRVALKLIKAGMDTRRVIARFEAERQALAQMDHPNVSKIFDAGETDEGRPYFVMEYVEGVPITEHCDRDELTTARRIQVFLTVCDAVQHAHQKAILHRDLKPSNVLVTEQDGRAVPKVIDFGMAKAIAEPLTERSLFTEVGTLVGTPEYMSPEQADPLGRDVDTRSDVYALGVILYELLTGAMPFDPKTLREAGFEGLLRIVREVEPPRPSARFASLGDLRSSESAGRRSVDAATLRRQLSGELDWITMKALAKERDRRYGSPAELAEDLRRYLRQEPVLAGPPGAAYRTRKFVRRHRLGVAAAIAGIAALAAFAAILAVQRARIAREAETTQRVSEFLTGLFAVSDPSQARGASVTARELLNRGAARIRAELGGEPRVQAELMATIGFVYSELGLYAEARPLLDESLAIRRRELGPDHPETLRTASETGRLLGRLRREHEAATLLVPTFDAQRRVLGPEHPDTLKTMNHLAGNYWDLGKGKESEALSREALAIEKRVLGPEHEETLRSMHALGLAIQLQGRLTEAEAVLVETLALRKRVLGPDHPYTLNTMMHLALSYNGQGRLPEYETLLREVLAISIRVKGPRHPDTVGTRFNIAAVAAEDGRRDEALAQLREAVETGFDEPEVLENPRLSSLAGAEFSAIMARARENARGK